MRILLVEPRKAPTTIGGEDVFLYEPLALEYVAAGVSSHHDVRILDLRLGKDFLHELTDFRPDVVGITAYTVHVNTVKHLFRQTKQWNEQVLTIVGGHHATVMPGDFLSPHIDLIVRGEGVQPFRAVVDSLEKGNGFDGIPGLTFTKGTALVNTEPTAPIDLDACPPPERRLTADYRRHYYSEWMKPLASIRTSKGCPNRCNFCALWKLTGGRYCTREPEKVVEELAGLEEEYVFFADDESLVDARRMETLATLIADTGLRKRYFLYGRSDTIARNPDLLELWRDVGLERVFVGLEFFRDEDLEFVGKGSTRADNEKAIHILKNLGIEIYASFIIRPEFDRADFAAFRQHCRDLDLSFASFAVLTPLPGTDFYEEVKHQLITNNYDYFDFIHTLLPTALPLQEFYEQYYRLYRQAVPFSRSLTMLGRYSVWEIPPLLYKYTRFLNRLKTAYQDYEGDRIASLGDDCRDIEADGGSFERST